MLDPQAPLAPPRAYTLWHLALMLNVSRREISKWMDSERLPSFRVGQGARYSLRASLEQFSQAFNLPFRELHDCGSLATNVHTGKQCRVLVLCNEAGYTEVIYVDDHVLDFVSADRFSVDYRFT